MPIKTRKRKPVSEPTATAALLRYAVRVMSAQSRRGNSRYEANYRRCLGRDGAPTGAQLLERFLEQALRLFLGATFLHVREVSLVRLKLGDRRRVLLVTAGGKARRR